MNITGNDNNTAAFRAKFVNNQAFKDVVKYANETRQLQTLDTALNKLNNANKGDILLIHGKTDSGMFSNFTSGRRSVQNIGAETPEKASFNAILDLAEFGRKFTKLFGEKADCSLTPENVIKKYTV